MKKEKVINKIGDIVVAEFLKNQKDGKKPVCIINGIIGFINRSYRGPFIDTHSIWHVEIDEINAKSLVVTPVQEIKTAFENKREIANRIKQLTTKHEKFIKPKVHYPYKSKQERG